MTHDTKATTDGHETCSVWSFGDTSAVLAMFFQHHWVLGFGERCGGGFRTCSWGPSWESRSELVVLSDDKVNGCPPSSMIYRCLRQFKTLIFPIWMIIWCYLPYAVCPMFRHSGPADLGRPWPTHVAWRRCPALRRWPRRMRWRPLAPQAEDAESGESTESPRGERSSTKGLRMVENSW